ncbi:MAG TPA: cytochrome c oxidase assembly protein [Dehalococcoidia bacterium]|nr:cytochrome c oxidase assembly protein [Dehalococcoidia bacterium]MDP6272559.1 cytochrome c oxidase assembly protein [Dehalococcoidia bacterium]MDP7159659.1 cytochrome c oxidase assembly protein [Dehalococcoidia bacterium]MDP7212881.1 cytochrome c oxidase assembly protein [Dehalococcoidia bacterium]MDP7514694.1 cytochrome c oxidase assembly protein [Dehalococcoidia bacterium]
MLLLHLGGESREPLDSFSAFWSEWALVSPVTVVLLFLYGVYLFGLYRLNSRAGKSDVMSISAGRVALTTLGFAALTFALVGPVDVLAEDQFFLHMIQHLMLTLIAAPLMLAASPVAAYLWSLPADVRHVVSGSLAGHGRTNWVLRKLTFPRAVIIVYILTMYVWHLPVLYDAAIHSEPLHYLEHLMFFGAGMMFWWPIAGPAPMRSQLSYPQRLLYLMLAFTPSAALGAGLTLVGTVLYTHYEATPMHWGVGAGEDQSIGGLIMWVPGSFILVGAATVLFFKWYESEARGSRYKPKVRVKP